MALLKESDQIANLRDAEVFFWVSDRLVRKSSSFPMQV